MTRQGTAMLEGRHAVVTGAGRGIGAAIASALAAAGADLTVMGRTRAPLEAQVTALRSRHGVRAVAVTADVGDPSAVQQAFADAVSHAGAVHILVNNAGIADAAAFAAGSLESWERTLRVNLTGPFLCIHQVLPAMVEARGGRIVNIASTAALRGYAGVSSYCASKHGLLGLTRALAAETAKAGITVNAVCPGYTDHTDMLRSAVENVSRSTGRSADEARAAIHRRSPRGTLVTLDEVADAVLWLCSPGASAITGQAITVAAGEVM